MESLKDRLSKLSPEQRAALLRRMGTSPAPAPTPAPIASMPAAADKDLLSPAQQRMWVFERMTGDASAYTIVSVLRVRGALDPVALEWSINDIVRRHEALRTTFVEIDGVPRQRVAPRAHVPVSQLSLQIAPEASPDAVGDALAECIRALTAQPFDLAVGPLLRLAAIRITADDWALVATMHHIIADGWSLRLIERELSACYAQYVAGISAEAPCPLVQYRDYVVWQSAWLQAQGPRQHAYWTSVLEGAPACWPMPTRRPRTQTIDLAARTSVFAIDAARTAAVRALAEHENASVFMVLAASLKLVLGLYAGTRDLSIGTPVANRREPRFDATIGLFANTVVLRTVQRGGSFRDWLGQVRTIALEAFQNQDVPFEQVVDALRPERSSTHPPLFQMLFALQSTEDSDLRLPGLDVSPIQLQRPASEFDMILEAFFQASEGQMALTWRTALFDDATMLQIQANLLQVLDSVVSAPDQQIDRIVGSLGAKRVATGADDAVRGPELLHRHCPLSDGAHILCADDLSDTVYDDIVTWAGKAGAQCDRIDVIDLPELIERHRPDVLVLTAASFAQLREQVEQSPHLLEGIERVLVHGDAPMSEHSPLSATAELWQTWDAPGMSGICLLLRAGNAHAAHCGEIICVDALGRPLPFDAIGELAWVDDGTTRPSGLRGRLHADGSVLVDGFTDSHNWFGGHRVDAARVERVLRAVPGMVDAAIMSRRDAKGVWRAVACIVAGHRTTPEVFDEALAASGLSRHERPYGWVAVSRLPRGRDGRLDTVALSRLPIFETDSARILRSCEALRVEAPEISWSGPEAPRPWQVERPVPRHSPENDPRSAKRRLAVIDAPVLAPSQCPASLPAMLRRAAEMHGEQGVVYLQGGQGEASIQTYRALLQDAVRVMAGLRDSGVAPGERVLLQFTDNRRLLTAFWGCVLCGALPILVGLPATDDRDDKDLAKIVNAWPALALTCVLTSSAHAAHNAALASALDDRAVRTLWLESLLETVVDGADAHNVHEPAADDVALLLLTSGSTGIPKAVMQSHAALAAYAVAGAQRFGFDADAVSFNWMPIDHVGGLVMHHLQYVHVGARQIHCETRLILEDPLRWIDELSRYRATTTWAPNFAYALVNDLLAGASVEDRNWNLGALACVFNGGESVVPRTARTFLRLLAPYALRSDAMKPVWGMSETSSGTIFNESFDLQRSDDAQSFVSVGTPIPGMSIRIADGEDRPVPEGRNGRLQVRGPTITSGYLNNPGATAASFTADGWFVTGDLAVVEDGELTITGREKDLIIVNGINYHGHEIEQVVETVPGIPEAHVAACGVRRREDNTDRLAIFYSVDPAADRAPAELRTAIARAVLERVGIPATYLIPMAPEELPRTSIGKIQRPQLAQRFAQGEFDLRLGGAVPADAELPAWFHSPGWMPCGVVGASFSHSDACSTGAVLLVGGPEQVVSMIADVLVREGRTVRRLRDDGNADGADSVDLSDRDQIHAWLASLEDVSGGWSVLLCAALTEPLSATRIHDEWTALLRRGPASLLAWAQASARCAPGRIREVVLASRGAFAVSAQEAPAIEHAALIGLFRAIAQEQPDLRWRHLDIDPAATPVMSVPTLLAEWRSDSDRVATTVALRRGVRYLPVLREVVAPKGRDPGLAGESLNVITGGYGGIGALWAEWLLRHTDQSVLLVGRSPVDGDPRRVALRARLAGYGARFRDAICDVCDTRALGILIADLELREREQGEAPLCRVFHLAGAFHEVPVADETAEGLAEALRAKALGGIALHLALRHRPEVELVHFGSVNGFFGGAGVAAYAAANSVLEALALQRRSAGGRARCLAWSMWDDIGMSRGYGRRMLVTARGFCVLDPGRGLDSLREALAMPELSLTIGLDATNPNIARHLVAPVSGRWRLRAATTQAVDCDDPFGMPYAWERSGGSSCDDAEHTGDETTDPRTRSLAAVWCDVLRVPEVRAHDNFFALGGDSIMAIQVVARAAKIGIALTSRAVLEAQTLRDLVEAAGAGESIQAEQGVLSGPAPLGPAQAWFFDLALHDAHHMNQSVLLRMSTQLDADALSRALSRVLSQHDMLRVRFDRDASGRLVQSITGALEVQVVEHQIAGADHALAIQGLCDRAQASLDLSEGPLFQAHLLRGGAGDEDRLLLVAHHLIVDGVSWRLIVDALEQAYLASEATEDALLKGSSYRQWVTAIANLAHSELGMSQLPYWSALGDVPTCLPPPDHANGSDLRYDERSIEVALDVDATRALVQRLPSLTGIGIEDLLLSALQRAHAHWTGADDLYLTLEGHGRDLELPGIDIARTVGWFTSVYPVRLHGRAGTSALDAALAVRDTLALVPDRGALHLALRHLGSDETRMRLAALSKPAISFNYLGRFDAASGRLFSFAPEAPGTQIAPAQQRIHAIDVIGAVHEECLRFSMIYAGARYRPQTIQVFADAFVVALRELAGQVEAAAKAALAVPDVLVAPLRALGRGEPAAWVERILPASPMQTGLIYDSEISSVEGAYVSHLVNELMGTLDVPALHRAWRAIVDRHDVYRSAFVAGEDGHYHAAIVVRAELPWTELDWRGCDTHEQDARFDALVAEDGQRGFNLASPPLIRIHLVRMGDDRYRMLISEHHAVSDGWSRGIVLAELAQCYRAFVSEGSPALTAAPSFGRYIDWLSRFDRPRALAYWSGYLDGMPVPVPYACQKPAGNKQVAVERWHGHIEAATSAKVVAFARTQRTTVSALAQTAWAMIMSAHTGSDEIAFLTTHSGRPEGLPDVERIVGPFIQTVPVRVVLSRHAGAAECTRALQRKDADLVEYGHLPLFEICSGVGRRDLIGAFHTYFVYENFPLTVPEDGEDGLRVAWVKSLDRSDNPLMVMVVPGERLELLAYYREDMFSRENIDALFADFTAALRHISGDAGAALSTDAWLAPERRMAIAALRAVPVLADVAHTTTTTFEF